MYGNGVRTGMEAIAAVRRRIRRDRHLALAACFVVLAGATAARGAVGCRVVATAIPTTSATSAASA